MLANKNLSYRDISTGLGRLIVVLVCMICLLVTGCDESRILVIRGHTMGTTYSVKVIDEFPDKGNPGLNEAALKAELDEELAKINLLMSTYIQDSEISQFNSNKSGQWMEMSSETMDVVRFGMRLGELSNGAFDITVGPLVNLWGFGPDIQSGTMPSAEAVENARSRVGYQSLEVEQYPGLRLRKHKDIYVDLSAIAKGYAVDRLSEILMGKELRNFLVEIGGELRSRGVNDQGHPWRIGIENPAAGKENVLATVQLQDMAVATSGDYRNFFILDGKRFSHTINPGTGYPVSHQVASVTVLSRSAMEADGWATTLNVLGEEKGMELAERFNLSAMFVVRHDSGFQHLLTPAFEKLLENQVSK